MICSDALKIFFQEKDLIEKNVGDISMEDETNDCVDDLILDADGERIGGQPSKQHGHSHTSRKRSHSNSDRTNLWKEKQPVKKTSRQPRIHDRSPSNKRPRRPAYDEISLLQRKIEKSEQSISKLKAHMDKGTCPKDLRYDAKANIFPDEDFKSDIRALRKAAEQKFIGALTRFHYRRTERTKDKLCKAKPHKPDTETNANRASTEARLQSDTRGANSFPESIQSIVANLDKRLQEVNVMMKKPVEAYPCLLSV